MEVRLKKSQTTFKFVSSKKRNKKHVPNIHNQEDANQHAMSSTQETDAKYADRMGNSPVPIRDYLLSDEANPESLAGAPPEFDPDQEQFSEQPQSQDPELDPSNYYPDRITAKEDYENFNLADSQNPQTSVDFTQPMPQQRKDKEGSKVLFLLQKFTLYETKTNFYIVGSNARETRFRILEINLTVPKDKLSISEKGGAYNRHEVIEILAALEDENKNNGGFTKRLTAWGIMGFIRFTQGFYMSVITKRSTVALLGGHYVYHIDDTQLIPLCHSSLYKQPDRRSEENRYLTTFQSLDLSKTFYFSYTYDITQTLQTNLVREKRNLENRKERKTFKDYNEMFVWNHALLKPMIASFENSVRWCLPIIHGFMDQAKINVFGKTIYITIIARRSQYFAGARFLKRGANVDGKVANEVETEQIVADINTSSFHDPRTGLFNNPRYTSYVQHRGSIPLFWSQDVTNMSPKPPIELDAPDPFFSAAALHFDDMFKRYGPRIRILNLIKRREKHPRETKLGNLFNNCIIYLNQFLPKDKKLHYTAWDMSRASKSRDQDVIEFLENYAENTLQETGFFHNGKNAKDMKIQSGICRTNCIDCLDRTNAAQFVIGKKALGYQLHVLNVISGTEIDYDSDAVNLLTEMFHDHGDTIALQYGGSHLVNTMETYRKINQWSSHSRDLIESIRRFYSNSFIDSQRQDAINLFLGNFKWEEGKPRLWDLSSDYYLHNNLSIRKKFRRSYIKWWTPCNLEPMPSRVEKQLGGLQNLVTISEKPEVNELLIQRVLYEHLGYFDNYWNEYYKPRLITSFQNLFAFNMNSTLRYVPQTDDVTSSTYDPFKSRKPATLHRSNKQKDKSKTHSGKHLKNDSHAISTIPEHHEIERSSTNVELESLVQNHKSPTIEEIEDTSSSINPQSHRDSFVSYSNNDTETSSGFGAFVQASSKFYKRPTLHRLLSEPARLWGGLKGEGNEKANIRKERLNSTDTSLGGSIVLGVGPNMGDSYVSSDSYEHFPGESKSSADVLDSTKSSIVSEEDMHIYSKFTDIEKLMAPVKDYSSSGRANLPSTISYPPMHASKSGIPNHNDDSNTNLKNLNLYHKSLKVYDRLTETISPLDERFYEYAYNISHMKPINSNEPSELNILSLSHPNEDYLLGEIGDLDLYSPSEPTLLCSGSEDNLVPTSTLNYYSNWNH